jgi:hypothetical protein
MIQPEETQIQGNVNDRIRRLWALVATNADKTKEMLPVIQTKTGTQTAVCIDPENLTQFREVGQFVRSKLPEGCTLKLVQFSRRMDMEIFTAK